MSSGIKHRPDIDGLRAVAVIPVILGHAGVAGMAGGYVGVDVFFVISGFLISSILIDEAERGRFSIARFYERRARRIFPALFFMLATVMAASFVVLPPGMLVELGRSTLFTVLFVSNLWFDLTTGNYFGTDSDMIMLLHTWSLGVEEQFYLVFPLLLTAVFAAGGKRRRNLVVVVWLLLAASFLLSLAMMRQQPSSAFFQSPARAWELLLGVLLATGAFGSPKSGPAADILSVSGALAIVYAVVAFDSNTAFPGTAALLPTFGAATIIWAGTGHTSLVSRILSLKPLVWIGLISYSLYLWHWPILVGLRIGHAGYPIHPASLSAALLLALILATFSWRFVERPFRKRGAGPQAPRQVFVASGMAMVVLSIGANAIVFGGGFPQRMPADTRLAYQTWNEPPFRSECHNIPPGPNSCRIGDALHEKVDFVLWGDSHAGSLMPGLADYFDAQGKSATAIINIGCAPVVGITRVDKGAEAECSAVNDAAMAYIRDTDGVQAVVLVARWPLWAEGTRPRGESGSDLLIAPAHAAGAPGADVTGNFPLFAAALDRTVDGIVSLGKQVVIIEGIPEVGFSVPLAVGNSIYFGSDPPQGPTPDQVAERRSRTRDLFAKIAMDPNVAVVSASNVLCEDVCRIHLDGRPLYRDDDHLSEFASRWLVPILMQRADDKLSASGRARIR